MKKLSTISLFIFGVAVISILTAGLVFYQNKKDNKIANVQNGTLAKNTIDQIKSSGKNITLNMEEIAKHNKQSDCWVIISDKAYDLTSYFGSHPGGNSTMSPTCGTDATIAYATRDPNATKSRGSVKHSSYARDLLNDYYLGDLNQIIGEKSISTSSSNATPKDTTSQEIKISNSVSTATKEPVVKPANNVTLNILEIAKHNKQTDCWLLISGKVYNITSYFGSHPGGNSKMLATCGTDATNAYMTQDPNATSSGTRSAHSSNAVNLLSNYYIGDFNQTIGQQKIVETNSVVTSGNMGDDEDDDEWDD